MGDPPVPSTGDDEQDPDGGFRPPLPPEDRLWRHPSEVAATRAAPAPTPPPGTAPGSPVARTRPPTRVVAVLAVMIGLTLVAGFVAAVDDMGGTTSATGAPSWLGVRGTTDSEGGVRVVEVIRTGPAHRGGMRTGDVIVLFAGHQIHTIDDLVTVVHARAPGAACEVEVVRGTLTMSMTVLLAAADD